MLILIVILYLYLVKIVLQLASSQHTLHTIQVGKERTQ